MGNPPRVLGAATLLAIAALVVSCGGTGHDSTPTPAATATAAPTVRGELYDPGKQFAMTDLFDLALLPKVPVGDWKQLASGDQSLSIIVPKEWTWSSDETSLTASKPVLFGKLVGICKTVPGWSKVDLSVDTAPVQESTADGGTVRDVIEVLPSNNLRVEILQIAGSSQCGPDYGVLAIIPRPPGGQVSLSGEVFVQFPASADDIARAFAIVSSIKVAGGSPVPATPIAGIGVSKNSVPVGTYATMDEAVAKASDLGGFQVLPVLNLPPGFTVSFFDALTAQPDPNAPYKPPQDAFYPRHVQIGVRSDSGGLLIDESSVRTTDEGDARKIATTSLGDFYENGPSDAPLKFELVTADRTFTILAPRANLTQSQALAILGAFR